MQRPLALGTDVVAYFAAEHIDGQGRSLGRALLGDRENVQEKLSNILRLPARRSVLSKRGLC